MKEYPKQFSSLHHCYGVLGLYRIILLLLTLYVSGHTLFAYTSPPFIFEQLSNKEGLNQNSINSIIQDRTGFIWMGTPNGLIKYDGNTFITYNHKPSDTLSLTNNLVLKVFEDSEGYLWVGTTKGLCLFQPNTNNFKWVNDFNQNIDENLYHLEIVESPSKEIWITANSKIFTIKKEQNNQQAFTINGIRFKEGEKRLEEVKIFRTVHFLPDSTILLGTNKGLFHLRQEKEGVYTILNPVPSTENNFHITTLFEDKQGLIWVGGTNNLKFLSIKYVAQQYQYNWQVKPVNAATLPLKGVHITDINYGQQQQILIGTHQEGLFTYALDSKQVVHYQLQPAIPNSISSDIVNDILVDKSGVIWLATAHGGINKIDVSSKPFFNIGAQYFNPKSLSSNLINTMTVDSKQRLWVGTFQHGLNVTNTPFSIDNIYQLEFNHYLSEQSIGDLLETNDRLMLIGTKKGLKIFDLNNDQFVPIANNHPDNSILQKVNISSILQIGRNIWIATWDGLIKISLNKSSRDLLSGEFVLEIVQALSPTQQDNQIGSNKLMYDSNTGIWLGSREGLFRVNDMEDTIAISSFRYEPNNKHSIGNNNIFPIIKDSRNNIWVGTFGGGLNKILFENNQLTGFQRITKDEGLPNNAIYGIVEDETGNLWLSTDEGIVRYNPKNGTNDHYNMEDGLSSNNFRKNAYLSLEDGTIIMGGLMGLTAFHPKSITKNSFPPFAVITNLKLFNQTIVPNQEFQGITILNKPIHETKSLTLPYYLNQVTLEFAAMHYAASNKNFFQYQLEGVDNNWITVGSVQRFANYSQLQPGNYVFKLRSFNGDGVQSEDERVLKITINKPFYYSNVAILLYLILFAITAYLLYHYIKSFLQLRRRVAEEERTIKHIQEINEAKLKFFTDISHEFRTPLTLIISPLERVMKHPKLPPDLKELLVNINKNGDKLMNLTNTLIDFRKVEEGVQKLVVTKNDLGVFVRKTANAFSDYASDKKIYLAVNVPKEAFIGWFDPAVIERILFNLLSNAFKYTAEGGNITISMDQKEKNFATIKISDTGKGMSEEEVQNIFQRFFQGKEGKNLFGSSGIGLSLVKKLIELHKGKIQVLSKEGKGSSFEITLPIGHENYQIDAPFLDGLDTEIINIPEQIQPDLSIANTSSEDLADITLLVIEDNLEIRTFIASIFADTFIVLQAGDGKQGLEMAIEHTPNVIISDVMMPVMDGFELSEKLKKDIRTSHIPLILLTALTDFESQKTAFKKGGDIYISKPFSPQLLALQVNNLLNTKQKEATFQKTKLIMQPIQEEVSSIDEEFLKTLKEYLEQHYVDPQLSVKDLAGAVHLSYIQFYRKFKALTGINAKEYIRSFRMEKAANLLIKDSKKSINEVMYAVGYSSQSYFTSAFKKEYGKTPAQFKKSNINPPTET